MKILEFFIKWQLGWEPGRTHGLGVLGVNFKYLVLIGNFSHYIRKIQKSTKKNLI